MSMRTTPSYTLTSLATILRSLLTEYAGALFRQGQFSEYINPEGKSC